MCGITGFWDPGAARSAADSAGLVRAMADTMTHRGPDDFGEWVDPEAGVAFGHRRLSIVDLSPTGRQPMTSASGRFVLCMNGEIYNHRELRAALEGPFRGTSDTEVFLAAIERWGLEEALRRGVGMFGFALYDTAERTLTLVRDRLGEKPLYFARRLGALVFGSEMTALRTYPGDAFRVSRPAVAELLTVGYVRAPRSIYAEVEKVRPGEIVRFEDPRRPPRRSTYWSLREVACRGRDAPFRGDGVEAAEAVERQLDVALASQVQADVPVGAFLSGGIDSSTLVSLMQEASTKPVRTFTIGFDDPKFNEADHARAVAEHLGTEHTQLMVGASDALDLIPELPRVFDEPMADYSQLPTFLVAKMTRQHVTVSVSADGGDELFGGYHTYRWSRQLWRSLRWAPRFLRRVGALTTGPIASVLDRFGASRHADRLLKASRLLGAKDGVDTYLRLTRHGARPPVRGGVSGGDPRPVAPPGLSLLATMRLLDATSYLPGDVLTKVDRTSMANSLESRAPLLDHRLVELAFSLPDAILWDGARGKLPLRAILHRRVPRALVERKKMGFSPPMAKWLRGPLRPWAEELLSERRLAQEGYFDVAAVRSAWLAHARGQRDLKFALWDILCFQAWNEAQ